MRDRLIGYASMALAATTWGSIVLIIPLAHAPALMMVEMRMGFGAIALGTALLIFGRKDIIPKTGWRLLIGLGIALAVNWTMLFRGIQLIGATALLIGYVFPVLVAIAAPFVLHEKREPHVLPLAALGMVGLIVIIGPSAATGGELFGHLLAVGAAILSVALILGARKLVDHMPGPVASFWQTLVGAVLLLPLAVASNQGHVPWKWGIILGVVHTALAGVFFFRAIGRMPAQEAGILMYLEPASAVLFAWWLQNKTPSQTDLIGGGLVLAAGLALVVTSARIAQRATSVPSSI